MSKNYVGIQKLTRFVAVAGLILAVMLTAMPSGTLFAAPIQQAAGPVAVGVACTTLQPNETASMDAWINQDKTTENKNDSELRVLAESGKLNRSLIAFDLTTAVPTNAKVTSATLSLWVKEVKEDDATVRAHQILDSWTESGVTWRYQDKASSNEWANAGGDYSSTVLDSESLTEGSKDYWATFNVSAAAQSWAANPAANYGVILESPASSDKPQVKFKSSDDGTSSQRPKLEVCWNEGVGITPDNLAQGTAGQNNLYAHTVTVKDFTGEPVGLSAVSNQGWTVNIYKDVNGNGQKDAEDTSITQTPAMGPNGSYKILVEVVVPANAPNGTKDITTVTATGLNNGTVDTAKDTTLVGFPPVADPVLDGRRDRAYTQSLDSNTQDYCDASGKTLARLMTLYDVANPDYVWVVLEMDLAHADNSYGSNAHPSWAAAGKSQSLGNLKGSDKGQVILRDANGTVIFDVTADYLDDSQPTISGWGSGGVTDGEGSVSVGSASQVAVETSIGYDLNRFCTGSSSCTVNGVDLLSSSPPVNADYTPVSSAFADWQFPYLYEFRFDRSAFGSAGFGSASIDAVHISPNKTGSNEIPVTPCDGSIGDRVWQDNNGDKIQDSGESGLNGVMINLYRDTGNGTFEPDSDLAIDTQFTAGDGDYDFTGLGPGVYFVDVVNSTVPAGYVLTTANDPLKVTLAKGQDYNDADFGYRTLADVAISKTLISSDPAPVGSTIEFSIRITNTGNSILDVLPLKDIFDPAYLEFLSATPAHSSVSNGVVTWDDLTVAQGNLAAGASTSVTVRFKALKTTTVVVRSAVSGNGPVAETAGVGPAIPTQPAWNIEIWPSASCSGWEILFDRAQGSADEQWQAKLDGTVFASGTIHLTSGKKTITGAWPDGVNLATGTHTFQVEIYEGGNWLNRKTTFGPCAAPGDNVCYAVADGTTSANDSSQKDTLASLNRLTGGTTSVAGSGVGNTNRYNIEAISFKPGGTVLYAADAGQLGTLNLTTGLFTPVGTGFGTGNGSEGNNISFNDVDGLSFDPTTNILYGTLRRGSDVDLLFQINPDTGLRVANAFGAGVDYVAVPAVSGLEDVDDIAVDPLTGVMYAIVNNGSSGESRLVTINKATGAATSVGSVKIGGSNIQDIEGLSFFNDGKLYGSSGKSGPTTNALYQIDPTTAVATLIGSFTDPLRDFEALACLTQSVDTGSIGDRVWYDVNGDADQTGEQGINGVTVRLYAGACPASGSALKTTITAGDGDYLFSNLAAGDYCVDVDDTTLPATYNLTTANEPLTVALAQDQNYLLADFGYRLQQQGKTCDVATVFNARDQYGSDPGDVSDQACVAINSKTEVEISKILNTPSPVTVGQEVVFTIRITNTGQSTIVTLPLKDIYDATTLSFLGAVPASDDTNDDGVLNWSDLTTGFGKDLAPGQHFDVVVRFQAIKTTAGNVMRAATSDNAPYRTPENVTPAGAQSSQQPLRPLQPAWAIEIWPSALCSGWSIEFERAHGSSDEQWRAKLDGTVFTSGTISLPSGSKTISGAWPSGVDLTTGSHTLRAEIYEGGSWLARSATFGPCAAPATGTIGDRVYYDTNGDGGLDNDGEPGINNVKVNLYGGMCSATPTAAILVDRTSTGTVSNATTLKVSHLTGTGSNRLMLVGVSINDETSSTNDHVTGIKYGTKSLTLLGTVNDNNSAEARVEIWALVNPPSGTADVTVTFSRASADGAVVGVTTFTGVNQTTPTGLFYSNRGNGTALSLTMPSAVGELVFDTAAVRSQSINSVGAGQAEQWRTYFNSRVGAGGSVEAGATNVTMSWTGASSADWALAGVSIKPATGPAAVIATATTAGDGNYLFSNLAAGDYCVKVDETTVPPTYNLTTANNPKSVNLPTNSSNFLDADFGYKAPVILQGTIGDRVWYDVNGDGVQQSGELGLDGVTVNLHDGACPVSGAVVQTAVTAGDGAYLFSNLGSGDYCVDVDNTTVPTGYALTTANDPKTVNLPTNSSNFLDADFGYKAFCPEATANVAISEGGIDANGSTPETVQDYACVEITDKGASIGDYVFYDSNADGIQDVGEPGLGNVTLNLYKDNGDNSFDPGQDTLVRTTTTDNDGGYIITNLPPGTYFVDVTDANGVLTGLTHTVGPQSQPDPSNPITLNMGDVYRDADFGYVKSPTPDNAIIGDTVWVDGDGDGVQDPGEPGIPGIRVCATPVGGGLAICDITDANGVYQVEVPAGTYTVQPTNPPAGYTATTPVPHGPVTVSPGDQYLNADFGYNKPGELGKISGTIWDDSPNKDGLLDGGEKRIPGVSVSLIQDTNGNGQRDPGEPIIATDTTDQNGDYQFDGVPAGKYLVLPTDTQNVLDDFQPTKNGPNPGQDNNSQIKPYPVTLPAGGTNPTGDFGYVRDSSGDTALLGNQVWYETDGNGIYNPDSGDKGIAGVTVDLFKGGVFQATTTTGAGGDYVFTSLAAGTYAVQVSDNAKVLEDYILTVLGPAQGDDNNNQKQAYQVVLPAAASNMTADFGYTRPSSIGDLVWYDADKDGIQDVGEPGIPNVTVDLYRNGVYQATTTTDADGGYIFPGLVAGTYTVDVTDTNNKLVGMTQIVANQGQPDPTGPITIGAGEAFKDADFAYVKPTTPGKAIIGDTVWYDDNGDGVQQPNEPGIPNVQVCATPVGGGGAVCATTDTNGVYRVEVPAGTYTVQPTNPPVGFTATTPVPHGPVTVDAGEQYLDADFGYDDPGQNLLGAIGNLVFVEAKATKDGLYNGADKPLAGVSVDLIRDTNGNKAWDAGEPIIATVTTKGVADANSGNYLFTGLSAGNYLVHVSDTNAVLLDYSKTILGPNPGLDNNNQVDPYAITLGLGGDNLTADFGYYRTERPDVGVLGNQVWTETDGNGLFDVNDGDMGQPGVTVKLLKDGVPYRTTTTGPSGDYSFVGLPAGNYTTQVTDDLHVLASYIVTKLGPNQGSDNNNQLQPYATALPTGGVNLTGDFGYILPAAIGDFVYYDTDKDGIQDVGEPGIPNVAVDLYRDTNNNGDLDIGTDEKIQSAVTDADGGYLFRDLIPGKYIVDVTAASNPNGNLGTLVHTLGNQSATDPTPAISLVGGTVYKDADFGYVQPTTQGKALIGDTVWYDANGDGVQQPEEPGIPGITVRATDSNGNTYDAVTDGTGTYRLEVPQGTYTVAPLNPPAGLTVTTNPTWGPNILLAGEQRLDADFGYKDNNDVFGSIGNLVFWDKNHDGVYNSGDVPLGGVSVDLIRDTNGNKVWNTGEPIIATATTKTATDANTGNYLFTGLVAGDYLVHVSDTNAVLFDFEKSVLGSSQTADGHNKADPYAITLGVAESNLTGDFGYYRQPNQPKVGVIGNQIWLETDLNGLFDVLDKDRGQAGVTVDLYEAGVKLATTTSGASGDYSFVHLPSGTYTVAVSDNEKVLLGLDVTTLGPAQGSDNNNQQQPYTVGLAEGGVNLTADFGYKTEPGGGQNAAQIGDTVWSDANNNGVFDSGEVAIGSVVVKLWYDADSNCTLNSTTDVFVGSRTTDNTLAIGNTNYLFEYPNGLRPGNYLVEVTDPNSVLVGATKSTGPTPGNNENSQANPYCIQNFNAAGTGDTNLTADFGYLLPDSRFMVTKVLISPSPVRPQEGIQFSIRITNTGATQLMTLPLADTYDTEYIKYVSGVPASVDNDNDGVINWTDLLSNRGPLLPGESVEVIVNFLAVKDTGELPNDQTINTASVSGVITDPDGNGPAPTNPTPLPPQSDQDAVIIINPTAAMLASSQAAWVGTEVEVMWQTVSESDVAGFNLLRTDSNGVIVTLNPLSIPAQRPGQAEGATYRWVDTSAEEGMAYTYSLEIIHLSGALERLELGGVRSGSVIFLPLIVR